MSKSSVNIGRLYESVVRFELEKHGWNVFEPRGIETAHIDMIAAKWKDGKLLLRAIQVKARTGLGTRYGSFDVYFEYKDDNYYYAVVFDSEDLKDLHIWLIPSKAVPEKIHKMIHIDDFPEFKGENGFKNLEH